MNSKNGYKIILIFNIVFGMFIVIASVVFSISAVKVGVEKDIQFLQARQTEIEKNIDEMQELQIKHYLELKDDISELKLLVEQIR